MKSNVPVISLDYMWMKGRKRDGEGEPKGNPILVMHGRNTKVTWSRVVLRKGVDPYSIKVLSDMICFRDTSGLYSRATANPQSKHSKRL